MYLSKTRGYFRNWRKAAEVGKRRIALFRTHKTCEANVQNFVLGPGTGPSPSGQPLLFRAPFGHSCQSSLLLKAAIRSSGRRRLHRRQRRQLLAPRARLQPDATHSDANVSSASASTGGARDLFMDAWRDVWDITLSVDLGRTTDATSSLTGLKLLWASHLIH